MATQQIAVPPFNTQETSLLLKRGKGAVVGGAILFLLGLLPPRDLTGTWVCLIGAFQFALGLKISKEPSPKLLWADLGGTASLWLVWWLLWFTRLTQGRHPGWTTPLFFLLFLWDAVKTFRLLRHAEHRHRDSISLLPEQP